MASDSEDVTAGGRAQQDILGQLEHLSRQGDMVPFRIGRKPALFLHRPEHFEYVLASHRDAFDKSHRSNRINRWALGEGLLTSDGAEWKRHRRIVNPAFHRGKLNAMSEGIVADACVTRARLSSAVGDVVSVSDAMADLTFRITTHALLGLRDDEVPAEFVSAFSDLHEELWLRLSAPIALPPVLPTAADRRFRTARRRVMRMLEDVIDRRRGRPDGGSDALSLLLEAVDERGRPALTRRELLDELMILMVAGHETTANLLTFVWDALSCTPDVREKLEEELRTVLTGSDPQLSSLEVLPYTRAIVKETLRLRPPVYAFSRACIRDSWIDGFDVRRGTYVFLGIYTMHRHARLWERPLDFWPDRFLSNPDPPPYQFVPFGVGPRRCIGDQMALMEAALVIATLAPHVRLNVVPDRPVAYQGKLTMRTRDGLYLRVADGMCAAGGKVA